MEDIESDIGNHIEYSTNRKGKEKKISGIIVDIKKSNPLINVNTGKKKTNTVKLKIKPDDGSRVFWTDTMERM